MSLFGMDSDLTNLVERCRRQDGRAWSTIVDRFSRLVYSIPRRYRLGEDDAADVFQGTFQALFQSIDRIEDPTTLPKWLSVTASRLSMRCLRSQSRVSSLDRVEGGLAELVASEDKDAEENAIESIQASTVREAVNRLKGRCGPLLNLLYLTDGSTYQDVCDRLGIPIGAIGPTKARCLEKLRRMLEEAGFFE